MAGGACFKRVSSEVTVTLLLVVLIESLLVLELVGGGWSSVNSESSDSLSLPSISDTSVSAEISLVSAIAM